jgi:hypothetical protein
MGIAMQELRMLRIKRKCLVLAVLLLVGEGYCSDSNGACSKVTHPEAQAITRGPKFHWFGYYDKLQFDPACRYVLGMEVDFEHRSPKEHDIIKVGMVDLKDNDRWIKLGESRAWCWQQGCMLQWRPKSCSEILWNDREGDRFVCRVMDVKTGKRRTIPYPIYHISPDGKWALGTDFSRINEMRPGYGYAGMPDSNRDVMTPTDSGIYLVNLDSGEYKFLFSVADIAKFRFGGESGEHKLYFNHVAWSPNGKRFLFFNRGRGVRTQVYTAAADGTDVRFLAEESSHFAWRDPRHVLIWSEGAYRLYEDDGSGNGRVVWDAPNGHVSYLPDQNLVVTDTYPQGHERRQEVYLYHIPSGKKVSLGRFHSPVQYKGEWRCDTHPRVSPDGKKVVIDSAHGGEGRQMYLIDISRITNSLLQK